MGLLKLIVAAIVGSAITLLAVVGPANLRASAEQAAGPILASATNTPAAANTPAANNANGSAAGTAATATQPGGNVPPVTGQAPRPGMTVPGGPAVVVPAVNQQTQAQQAGAQGTEETTVRVYQENRPSVVTVISSIVQPAFRTEPQPSGTGSGFIIDDQGHILTNNHVVSEADKLEVTLSDGTTFPAKLIGRDSRFDLAVIQAEIPANKLRAVTLGDSDQLQVGEQVIAIGNPYGLDGTVTNGIVSGRRQVVTEPGGDGVLVNAIQTDTSINPGNSGGPLLNGRGQVVGVATLGLMPNGGQAGLNFAIPINNAKRILDDLIANGSYPHPFVGIGTAEITSTMAQELQLPVAEGLLVQSVEPSSAAGQAGIKGGTQQEQAGARQIATGGDIIVAIDGKAMKRPEDFVAYLELNKKAGDPLTLSVVRGGEQRDLTLTLGERPAPQAQQGTPRQQPSRQQPGQGGQQPGFPFPVPGR